MAIITKYRLFERGDDDDIELGPKLKMKLGDDGKYYMDSDTPNPVYDYILSLPSGEVILINNIDSFKRAIDKDLIYYVYSFKGKVLNCYVCQDNEISIVREYLNEISKNTKVSDVILNICKEFRDEMAKVTKKNYIVAYIENLNNLNYYYVIIPDLEVNKKYYSSKQSNMLTVNQKMKDKYPKSIFGYTSRLTRNDVKYYGLPEYYDERGNIKTEEKPKEKPKNVENIKKKTSKEICYELKNEISAITKKEYDLEHYKKEDSFYYFNIPPNDITYFDNFGRTKINYLIYKYRDKYPYMEIDWLSKSDSDIIWESGIYVRFPDKTRKKIKIWSELKEELAKTSIYKYMVANSEDGKNFIILGDAEILKGEELNRILRIIKNMQNKYPDIKFEWKNKNIIDK